MFFNKSIVALMLFTAVSLVTQAQTLVSGHGVIVDAKEIKSDLAMAPPAAKESLAQVEALHNNVQNIFVRRTLAMESIRDGIDKNPLVMAAIEKAKERILSDAMLEKIDQSNQPSLQDIEKYAQSKYKAESKRFQQDEQVKIRHILIKNEEPDAKIKIEEVLKLLQSGADFATLAKAKSQDPGSAAKGGELGWVVKGRTVKPFEDAAFALSKPAELSPIISSPFGYHILKLDEKKSAGTKPFEEVKDTLMKEAQGAILNDGRFREQERILKDAKFETSAIEALAKEFAKP